MESFFVIRNSDGEYLLIDFDSDSQDESWVAYSEASWFDLDDSEWYNEGRFEVVEAV